MKVPGVLLLFLLLAALAPIDADASRTRVGGVVKDYRHGYSMRVPYNWERVPPQPSERIVVVKWIGKAQGRVPPTLRIIRIARPQNGNGSAPDVAEKPEPTGPLSVREWLSEELGTTLTGGRIEEAKDIRIGGDKCRLYFATCRGSSSPSGLSLRLLVAVVRTDRAEFGIAFTCPRDEFEKVHRAAFYQCIASFKPLVVKDESDIDYDAAFESALPGSRDAEAEKRWLAEIKRKTDRSRNWDHLQTEHYLVLYDKSIAARRVKRIAVHIEAIRREVFENEFPPDEPMTAISIVRVCKNQEQYLGCGGAVGSAGIWDPRERELIFWDRNIESIRVLYHEAFHQYIHFALGEVAPHIWFNEGHAEYYSSFEFKGRFIAKEHPQHMTLIRNLLIADVVHPLDKFLEMEGNEFMSRPEISYPQAWALVHYMRRTSGAAYRGALDEYFGVLRSEVRKLRKAGKLDDDGVQKALATALEAAFQGINRVRLESDWKAAGY